MAGAGITVASRVTDVDRLDTADAGSAVILGDTPALLTAAAPLTSVPPMANPDAAPATLPSIPVPPPSIKTPVELAVYPSTSSRVMMHRDAVLNHFMTGKLEKVTEPKALASIKTILTSLKTILGVHEQKERLKIRSAATTLVPNFTPFIVARYYEALVEACLEYRQRKYRDGSYVKNLETLRHCLSHNNAIFFAADQTVFAQLKKSAYAFMNKIDKVLAPDPDEEVLKPAMTFDSSMTKTERYADTRSIIDFECQMQAIIARILAIPLDSERDIDPIANPSANNTELRVLLTQAGKLAGDYIDASMKIYRSPETFNKSQFFPFMDAVKRHRNNAAHRVLNLSEAAQRLLFISSEDLQYLVGKADANKKLVDAGYMTSSLASPLGTIATMQPVRLNSARARLEEAMAAAPSRPKDADVEEIKHQFFHHINKYDKLIAKLEKKAKKSSSGYATILDGLRKNHRRLRCESARFIALKRTALTNGEFMFTLDEQKRTIAFASKEFAKLEAEYTIKRGGKKDKSKRKRKHKSKHKDKHEKRSVSNSTTTFRSHHGKSRAESRDHGSSDKYGR